MVFPPFAQIQGYAQKLEESVGHEVPYADMLLSLKKTSVVQGQFAIKHLDEELLIADGIQDIPFLSLRERYNFCKAPLHMRHKMTFNYEGRRRSHYQDELLKYSNKSSLKIFAGFVRQFAAGRTQEYFDRFVQIEKEFHEENTGFMDATSVFYR